MTPRTRRRQHKIVLVVDDDRTLCELIDEVLTQSLASKVIVAENAGRALELLNALKVDLIILDFWLPDMDGLRLHDLIQRKTSYSSIPVLFITAAHQSPEFQNRKPDHYLAKPFDLDEFLDMVKALLAHGDKPQGR